MRLRHLHGEIEMALGRAVSLEELAAMERAGELLQCCKEMWDRRFALDTTMMRATVLIDKVHNVAREA